jgi:hypothetical protein
MGGLGQSTKLNRKMRKRQSEIMRILDVLPPPQIPQMTPFHVMEAEEKLRVSIHVVAA